MVHFDGCLRLTFIADLFTRAHDYSDYNGSIVAVVSSLKRVKPSLYFCAAVRV